MFKRAYIVKLAWFVFVLVGGVSCANRSVHEIKSPDQHFLVRFFLTERGEPNYQVLKDDVVVVDTSSLGVRMQETGFGSGLLLVKAKAISTVDVDYTMHQGKQVEIHYEANEQVFELTNESSEQMSIAFRVSNDGVAFQYRFPNKEGKQQVIEEELTTYRFPATTKMYVQPMSKPKTGWQSTNPSYEESYEQGIALATPAPLESGWVYPALFKQADNWVLVSETGLEANYCGTRLVSDPESKEMKVGFPSDVEVYTGKGHLPNSNKAWNSPWRLLTIGSLKTIVESTMGTDLANPAIEIDEAFVKPGFASWSWAVLKDNSVNYDTTKMFIDYAHDMKWKYCLIDVNWDTQIGMDRMKELVAYADERNVGLILWYNSSGDWNTTPYHPKSKLLTHEQRKKEFAMLQKMGISGVKIDFFGGDGQSMIAYYHDVLQDAADYDLLVNFHGATLPRGWHRTYPHLMTVEAIKGFEFITFTQENADQEANHSAMLPFTRNAFDPMDFTPMCFSDIPNITRKTTNGFELALPTLFLSGIQHIAEIPSGMEAVPDYVKSYLSELPAKWDETRFIDGFPGKLAIIARRSGNSWYLTGINGEAEAKSISMDLSFLKGSSGYVITDGSEHPDFEKKELIIQDSHTIDLKPNGGFVMKLSK